MSKSNQFEDDLLKLIFNGTSITGLADNAASAPIGQLYMALHTADPGEAGNQSTSEVSYTGYSRVGVLRTTAGWIVSSGSVSPAAPVEFGEMTAGAAGTATFASVGTAVNGSGKILYRGQITPSISYAVGTQPRMRTTSTITED